MCYMPASMAADFYKSNIYDKDGNESIYDWITRQVANHVSSVTMVPLIFGKHLDKTYLRAYGRTKLVGLKIPVNFDSSFVYECREKITEILYDMEWEVTFFSHDNEDRMMRLDLLMKNTEV